MAANSAIQWTTHTFNPWRGCTKVSPGCTNCYAEKQSLRNPKVLGKWGPNGTRAIAAEAYWRQPLAWDRAARAAGERHRVFCASLADVFEDRPELDEPRVRLFDLILRTPSLDWLLLTKRPAVMRDWLTGTDILGSRIPHAWGQGWNNVWLGTSVEDQQRMRERGKDLLMTPAAVHFLSIEPLLGPVDASDYLYHYHGHGRNAIKKWPYGHVDWVIIGGESGPKARPCDLAWIRSLVRQCRAAGRTACFVKQLGSMPALTQFDGLPDWPEHIEYRDDTKATNILRLRDRKGGDPAEWSEDLRVREFPCLQDKGGIFRRRSTHEIPNGPHAPAPARTRL